MRQKYYRDKIMRKMITKVGMACMVLSFSGCSINAPEQSIVVWEETDQPDIPGTETGSYQEKQNENGSAKPDAKSELEIDLTSEENMMSFLRGEWRLCDPNSQMDEFATLSIDGQNCSFKRDRDKEQMQGSFQIGKYEYYEAVLDQTMEDKEYTEFELKLSGITKDMKLPDGYDIVGDECTTGGRFYIARGDGYDYLYLKWIGNGDSVIFDEVMQNADRIEKEYEQAGEYSVQEEFVFRKPNKGTASLKTIGNCKFYGWIWERDNNGHLMVQQMEARTHGMYDEYTGRQFMGGTFSEISNLGIMNCEISPEADLSLVFHTDRLRQDTPLMMCEFETDPQGKISSIRELNIAEYGIYDLNEMEQEYTFKGPKFMINDMTYSLEDYDPNAKTIKSMIKAKDWIVVSAEVEEGINRYLLVNTLTGNVEKSFVGSHLCWANEDITTAVYCMSGCIYNFKDHLVGTVNNEEVQKMQMNPDGSKVYVEVLGDRTLTIDVNNGDTALYRYMDFLHNPSAAKWNAFMQYAPDDAIAFVMVDVPEDIRKYLPTKSEDLQAGGGSVYVVALEDDTEVFLNSGEYNYKKKTFRSTQTIDRFSLEKGRVYGYEMTVPEGIPGKGIYIATKEKGGLFPVTILSGENDLCGTFITSSMTSQEALSQCFLDNASTILDKDKTNKQNDSAEDIAKTENNEMVSDASEDEEAQQKAIEIYEDVLLKYQEAIKESFSSEVLKKNELRTALETLYMAQDQDNEDSVKYVIYDLGANGTYELFITYHDEIVDIYVCDGENAKYVFGSKDGEIELHEDGRITERVTSDKEIKDTWYQYDIHMKDFFPLVEKVTETSNRSEWYYEFSYLNSSQEIRRLYGQNGQYPVWTWEWAGELTKEKYDSLCGKDPIVELAKGESVNRFTKNQFPGE